MNKNNIIVDDVSEKVKCITCSKYFKPTASQKHHYKNRGDNPFCSKECRFTHLGWAIDGHWATCKTCGTNFKSNIANKIYCNFECYRKDPDMLERLRINNENLKKRNPNYFTKITIKCSCCGKPIVRKKSKINKTNNFCNKQCYRKFLSERFDRYIDTNYEIKELNNYDEFLSKDHLPCLIEGCNWIGKNLSYHVNITHGIDSEKFKEMAGFNKKTGVVSKDVSNKMSKKAIDRIERGENNNLVGHTNRKKGTICNNQPIRKEGKEHFKKSKIILKATEINIKKICLNCNKPFLIESVLSKAKLYCSLECRNSYLIERKKIKRYILKCSLCSKVFIGNRHQYLRNKRKENISCTVFCRQSNNSKKRTCTQSITNGKNN